MEKNKHYRLKYNISPVIETKYIQCSQRSKNEIING